MIEPKPDGNPADAPAAEAVTSAGSGDDQAMETLIDASRLHRGAVMPKQNDEPLNVQQVGRIRQAANSFLQRQTGRHKGDRVTQGKLAAAIGEPPSVVSQVLRGRYPRSKEDGYQKRDQVLGKVDNYLSLYEARLRAPRHSGFAWTAVAEEIRGVANTVVLLGTIGVVYGPAGIGKTLTLQTLLGAYPGAVLLTIDDESHSPTTFLRTLCAELKLATRRDRQTMRKAVRECLSTGKRPLFVDEAHLASTATLTTIRQISDATGCPVLLAGLPALHKMLLAGRGDDGRGATLFSRVRIIRNLVERCHSNGDKGAPLFTVDDVRKVFAQSTVRLAGDATRWLAGLACLPEAGSLRAASNALLLAQHIAQQKGEGEITLNMLLSAQRLLLGTEGARAVAARVSQTQTKVA